MSESLSTYQGEPCKCGATEKYVKNKNCVGCARKRNRETVRIWRRNHPERVVKQNHNYNLTHRKQITERNRTRLYGISPDMYNHLMFLQKGICIGCPNPATEVDHDHKTGKVRGLLCPLCNKLLGLAKDNPTILHNLANYLETS
jgi:hypothetical protein